MRESEPIAVSVESTDKKAEEEDFMRAVNLVSEGRITKMDVDYTSAVDEALPRADALFKVFLTIIFICNWQFAKTISIFIK
jgi:hypothetical protein